VKQEHLFCQMKLCFNLSLSYGGKATIVLHMYENVRSTNLEKKN